MTSSLCVACLVAATSFGQAREGQDWSVVGARTVGAGTTGVEASAGFPSVAVGVRHGLVDPLEVGARVGFTYSLQGLFSRIAPGIDARALVKLRLSDNGRAAWSLVFEPGVFVTGTNSSGVVLPVGLRVGLAASSAFTVGLSLDVPVWFTFGSPRANVPILGGAGLEYFLKSDLVAFVRARVGPTLHAFGLAELTLDAALGIGWRL